LPEALTAPKKNTQVRREVFWSTGGRKRSQSLIQPQESTLSMGTLKRGLPRQLPSKAVVVLREKTDMLEVCLRI
jgi:hypothetical protein